MFRVGSSLHSRDTFCSYCFSSLLIRRLKYSRLGPCDPCTTVIHHFIVISRISAMTLWHQFYQLPIGLLLARYHKTRPFLSIHHHLMHHRIGPCVIRHLWPQPSSLRAHRMRRGYSRGRPTRFVSFACRTMVFNWLLFRVETTGRHWSTECVRVKWRSHHSTKNGLHLPICPYCCEIFFNMKVRVLFFHNQLMIWSVLIY